MKYFVLSELGINPNLKARTVIYDKEKNKNFARALGQGERCNGLDCAAVEHMGGKKPRFEHMIHNLYYGCYMLSQPVCDLIKPFLTHPDDVEWLLVPQEADQTKKFPCKDLYFFFNVQRCLDPEQCLIKTYKENPEFYTQPYIDTLAFNTEAAAGLHVFRLKYQFNNFFVSEELVKAVKKHKPYGFRISPMEAELKMLMYFANQDYEKKIKV